MRVYTVCVCVRMYLCVYVCMCRPIVKSFHLSSLLISVFCPPIMLPSFTYLLFHLFLPPPFLPSHLTSPHTPYSTIQLTVMKTRGKPEVSAQSSAEQVNKIIHCLSTFNMSFTCTNCPFLLLNSLFVISFLVCLLLSFPLLFLYLSLLLPLSLSL